MPEYTVRVGCQNDATGKRFEPGDLVDESEFPAEVVDAWLYQGVLDVVAATTPSVKESGPIGPEASHDRQE